MSLKKMIQELKETRIIAETPVEEYGPTAAFKMGEKRKAKEALEDMYMKYRTEMKSSTVFILIAGKNSDKAAKLSEEEFETYSMDLDTMYKDMADQISPEFYANRVTTMGLIDIVNSLTENLAISIDLIRQPRIMYSNEMNFQIQDKKGLIKLIKELHEKQIGLEFSGYYYLDVATKKAIADEFAGTTLPFVLYSEDSEFVSKTSKSLEKNGFNVFNISTDSKESVEGTFNLDTISKTEIKKVFSNIKKSLKGKES